MEEFLGGFGGSSIFPTSKSRTANRPSTSTAYGYGYLNNPPPELEQEPQPQQRKMESGIKYNFEERTELIPMSRSSQQLVPTSSNNSTNINAIFEIAAELVAKKLEQKFSQPQQLNSQQQLIMNALSQSAAFPSFSNAPQTQIVTGVVSQIQDTFGMVGKEVFFMLSNVIGPIPKLGDKVVVEAEPVSGMPFKMNGKRVQVIAKELSDSSSSRRNSQSSSSISKRRNSDIDFGPLPHMPSSLNLLDKWKKPSKAEKEEKHHRRPQPAKPAPAPPAKSQYNAQTSLSFDLSSDIPVIQYRENKITPSQNQKSLSSSSSKNQKHSSSRKSRSSSRSRSKKRDSSSSKRSSKKDTKRSRSSRSPKLSKSEEDIQIVAEYTKRLEDGSLSSNSSSGRKEKRTPRSIAAMIRHHVAAPGPESQRFVPNPLAKHNNGSTVLSNVGPAVMYLHNPSLVPPPSSAGEQMKALKNSLIDKKLSQIEEQERLLQMQERVLKAEMKLQDMERGKRSSTTSRGNEGSVRRLEIDNCRMPKWELPSKRSRRSTTPKRSSSSVINGVEWVTRSEDRRRPREEERRRHSSNDRNRVKRDPRKDEDLNWETRQDAQLAQRELEIRQRFSDLTSTASLSRRDFFHHDDRY